MEERKRDHIELAFQSRTSAPEADNRFCYEPLLASHPIKKLEPFTFVDKTMRLPIWVSSMTGGTEAAGKINKNLAKVCQKFGMGMGLGSCRVLLDNPSLLPDFNVRNIIGNDQPLYANLGICQLEKLIEKDELHLINELIEELKADGIIIHVNPLQEAFQPEGDILHHSPLFLIKEFLSKTKNRVIIKEVGQGMGPESLKELLNLPIEAIEFGALGGTNFSLLELHRHNEESRDAYKAFSKIGHTAEEMTNYINQIVNKQEETNCKQLIISGGITSIIDGYYLTKKSSIPAIFGMGSQFLKYALKDYSALEKYVKNLKTGWQLCESYLKINNVE